MRTHQRKLITMNTTFRIIGENHLAKELEITDEIINCIVHINDDLEEIIAKTIFGEVKENDYFEYHESLKKESHIISLELTPE